ncbi:DUF3306 domain-containing protein [Massilia sp. PWRC2]|uniref:DUF3306 domain-containing protein n=1 Tax=Massilia sp. PWRC2 TaxID=2804626 RepID=UPI003CE7418F
MADEGFLRRWARLKARPEDQAAPLPLAMPVVMPAAAAPSAAPVVPVLALVPGAPAEAPPPTLLDAAALTGESDFSTFVAKNVDAAVRRLAMKKLFADPHFHGHDGLDIYMGDYNLPSPVSADMLEQMSHNKNIFASLDKAIEQVDDLVGSGPPLALDALPAAAAPVAAPVVAPVVVPVVAPSIPDSPELAAAPPPAPPQEVL